MGCSKSSVADDKRVHGGVHVWVGTYARVYSLCVYVCMHVYAQTCLCVCLPVDVIKLSINLTFISKLTENVEAGLIEENL